MPSAVVWADLRMPEITKCSQVKLSPPVNSENPAILPKNSSPASIFSRSKTFLENKCPIVSAPEPTAYDGTQPSRTRRPD